MKSRNVVDMRTGLPHPIRASNGRFISSQQAAREVRIYEETWGSYSPFLNSVVIHDCTRRAK